MVKLVISGIAGRMGRRIASLALKDKNFEIIGALESPDNSSIGKDAGEVLATRKTGKKVYSNFSEISEGCDVLIDFTSPSATIVHLEAACRKKAGVVIGTTGFSSQEIEKIKKAATKIPIVFSPNMSIGANLLFKITELVSKALTSDYEVEIVEAHHSKKKDAPSGTAKRLGEAVSKVRGAMPPIRSIREGDIVGDHTVIFKGKDEGMELTHRAHSRDTFARGALDAARFLVGKKPGLYNMQDVIETKE